MVVSHFTTGKTARFYRAVKIIKTKNDVSQYSRSEKGYRSNNAQRY